MALEKLPSGAAKRAAVRSMFDRIAPRYDLLNRILSLGLDRRWRRQALRAVAPQPGDRLVDVACGTGDLAALGARHGARVVGVDFAGEMLRHARRRGIPASWVRADAVALPLPDGWATGLVCGFALRNFVSLDPVFAEMARVLAPGGRLALLEIGRPGSGWLRAGHRFYFERVVPRLGAWLSDRSAYDYLPRSVAYLPEREALLQSLSKAGFAELRWRRLRLGVTELYTGVRR